MTTDLCECFPPKMRILVSEGKVSFSLECIAALGDEAAQLAAQFQHERRNRLNECLTAARQSFLASKAWENVEALRARLAILAGDAAAANRRLNEIRVAYQENLRNGDPVSLLSEMSALPIEAESRRKAVDDFERENVRPAESAAQHELYKAIGEVWSRYIDEGRARYTQLLAELVESIDKKALIELALAETAALHNVACFQGPPGLGQPRSDEEIRFGTLPERGYRIARDSATPPPSPAAPVSQWGPGAIEYRDDRPAAWGPSKVERIL